MNESRDSPIDWTALLESLEKRLSSIEKTAQDGLREILEMACESVGSAESSVLVPTAGGENLKFLVSVNRELEASDIEVPCDKSIAGYVYSTGQLVSTGNVAEEMGDRHFRKVDEKTGTQTETYMVVPLTQGENTIGVLTFLNRRDTKRTEPFSPDEINRAQEFANVCGRLLHFFRRIQPYLQMARRNLKAACEESVSGITKPVEEAHSIRSEEASLSMVERLESLTVGDRRFVEDLLDLFQRYRDEGLMADLGLGEHQDESGASYS